MLINNNFDMIFSSSELNEPRMIVEKRKIDKYFPQFRFIRTKGYVTSVQGELSTNFGNSYKVHIKIDPSKYPHQIPTITLPDTLLDYKCSHVNSGGEISLRCEKSWSQTYSLVFLIAFIRSWLNSYENWRLKGEL